MANPKHLSLLKKGVAQWNAGRPASPDLSGADLSALNLTGIDLSGADLERADLSHAVLKRARLSRAKLRGANLSQADMEGANLSDADGASERAFRGQTLTIKAAARLKF